MKKHMMLHFLVLILLLLSIGNMALSFQETSIPADTPRVDLQTAFLTLAGIASLVTLLTESITKFLATALKIVLNGWPARATSFIVAGILVAVGVSGQIGLFDNVVFQKYALWQISIGGGIIIGLLANGIFTADVVQALLAFLKLRVPVTPPDSPPKS